MQYDRKTPLAQDYRNSPLFKRVAAAIETTTIRQDTLWFERFKMITGALEERELQGKPAWDGALESHARALLEQWDGVGLRIVNEGRK